MKIKVVNQFFDEQCNMQLRENGTVYDTTDERGNSLSLQGYAVIVKENKKDDTVKK